MIRRTAAGEQPEADLVAWRDRVAERRADANRRAAVRRRRRQALPAVVASSATLAGLGGAVAWVTPKLPMRTTTRLSSTPAPAAPALDDAALTRLAQQLAFDVQAAAALRARAATLGNTPAGPGQTAVASAVAAPAAGNFSLPASGPVPTLAPLPAWTPPPAPATHATTGASSAPK